MCHKGNTLNSTSTSTREQSHVGADGVCGGIINSYYDGVS